MEEMVIKSTKGVYRYRLIGIFTIIIMLAIIYTLFFPNKMAIEDATSIALISEGDSGNKINSDDNFSSIESLLSYSIAEQGNNRIKPENISATSAEIVPRQSTELKPKKLVEGRKYVIQLAALKNSRNIEELIALLRLNNYTVYTIPNKAVNGKLTRLFVGPYMSKAKADAEVIQLKALTKLNGQVVLFKP